MKSILQDKKDCQCYICLHLLDKERRYDDLHEHHIFYGIGKRKLSERYGLKVMLCPYHHIGDIRGNAEAVHFGGRTEDVWLKRRAQRAWEEKNTANPGTETAHDQFREIFGKNYLD
jgi:hypothetical protein